MRKTRERERVQVNRDLLEVCYIFRIVMPCSSNPCIIPSVNDPVVKSSVCVTGGQTLISNADGGECAV